MENIIKKTKERLIEYEKRQEEILKAAMRLFNANGYAATTTASIAKEAGVTEKTMYRHFKSKEALFAECIFSITADLVELWQRELDRHKDDRLAYLKAVAGSYAQFVANNPDKSMFLVHLYSYRAIPELDEGFRAFVHDRLNETEKVIEAMKKGGEIKSEIPPRVLAGVFIAQYFTAVFLNEFLGPELFNAETVVQLTKNLLRIDG